MLLNSTKFLKLKMKSKLPNTVYGSATKFAANAFGATDENDLD